MRELVKKHVYMYSGGNCRAVFRVCRAMIGDVIDLLGKDEVFYDETEESVSVSVYTNEMSRRPLRPGCDGTGTEKSAGKCKKTVGTGAGKISITGGTVKNE